MKLQNKLNQSAELRAKLMRSMEIQRIIPDAFEHGKINIRIITKCVTVNPAPVCRLPYKAIITRGDGSSINLTFEQYDALYGFKHSEKDLIVIAKHWKE